MSEWFDSILENAIPKSLLAMINNYFPNKKHKYLQDLDKQIDNARRDGFRQFSRKYKFDIVHSNISYQMNHKKMVVWLRDNKPKTINELYNTLEKTQGKPVEDIELQDFERLCEQIVIEANKNPFLCQIIKINNKNNHQDIIQNTTVAQTKLCSKIWRPSPEALTSEEEQQTTDSIIVKGYSSNRNFLLKKVHEQLKWENLLVLHGMGGIGKSELAKLYAEIYNDEYTADNKKNILFTHCGPTLFDTIVALPFDNYDEKASKQLDRKAIYNAKIRFLQDCSTSSKTLLVLDNLDKTAAKFNSSINGTENTVDTSLSDRNVIHDLHGLPKNLHIIITSRSKIKEVNCLEVKALPGKDALSLFYKYYHYGAQAKMREDNKTSINKILQEIRCNTLMIKLCASLLQERCGSITPEVLLTSLKHPDISHYNELIEHRTDISGDSEDSLQVFEHLLKVFAVANLSETAKEILRHLSLLPPEGLPKEKLLELCGWKDKKLHYAEMNFLITTNWLQTVESEGLVSMHPLISLLCYEELKPDADNCGQMITQIANTLGAENDQQNPFENVIVNRMKSLNKLLFLSRRIKGSSKSLLIIFEHLGSECFDLCLYYEALHWQMECLKMLESLSSLYEDEEKKSFLSTVNFDIGDTYFKIENYSAAKNHYSLALDTWRNIEQTDSLIECTQALGNIYFKTGNLKNALYYYHEALALCLKTANNNIDYYYYLNYNIGKIYKISNNYDESRHWFNQNIAIITQLYYDKSQPEKNKIKLIYWLGETYEQMDDSDQAKETYKVFLESNEHTNNNPSLEIDAHVIAGRLALLNNDNDRALEEYKSALLTSQRIVGEYHSTTAEICSEIASIHRKNGDFQDAITYFSQSKLIYEHIINENNSHTAICLYNIACTEYAMGEIKKAIESASKALKIQEKILVDSHPDIIETNNKLAEIFNSMYENNKEDSAKQKSDEYKETALRGKTELIEIGNEIVLVLSLISRNK